MEVQHVDQHSWHCVKQTSVQKVCVCVCVCPQEVIPTVAWQSSAATSKWKWKSVGGCFAVVSRRGSRGKWRVFSCSGSGKEALSDKRQQRICKQGTCVEDRICIGGLQDEKPGKPTDVVIWTPKRKTEHCHYVISRCTVLAERLELIRA